jgi:ABC-type multidrug transport system ATPase subunit
MTSPLQSSAVEIVGVLGPNGAGKTTTINMVLGVLATTTGNVEIDGVDIAKQRARALARAPILRPCTLLCQAT